MRCFLLVLLIPERYEKCFCVCLTDSHEVQPPQKGNIFTMVSMSQWHIVHLHLASCLWVHTYSPEVRKENCLSRDPLWQTSHVAVVLHWPCAFTPFKHHIFLLSCCVQFNCPRWIQSLMDPDLQQKQGSAFLHCVENNCRSVGQLGRCNGHCEWGGPSSQVNFALL